MEHLNEKTVDEVLHHYLWTGVQLADDPDTMEPLEHDYDVDVITKASVDAARKDVEEFIRRIKEIDIPDTIGNDDLGINFWLDRNGHGSGFWDRGWGEVGDKLHEIAKEFGEAYILPAGNNRHLHYESW